MFRGQPEEYETVPSVLRDKVEPIGFFYPYETDSIAAPFGGRIHGMQFERTYNVQPKHEVTEKGVKLNVETVSPAETRYRTMTKIPRQDALRQLQSQKELSAAHDLEAVSDTPQDLVFVGGHGFLAACMYSFAYHLPLSLDVNDLWTVIVYGFAKHVEKHAEELRSNFVQHKGKKRLKVVVDHFIMSENGNPDTGTPANLWEQDVFPSFSQQIKEHIGAKIHTTVAGNFTTTTATTKAVSEIALMSSMKSYFSFGMSTCCGIPSIELRGTVDDWVALRTRTEELGKLMTEEFSQKWMAVLFPILDEFVNSYNGNVNHGFWQTFVKLRETHGSGAHEELSGWIQNLYPYLAGDEENRYLRPWTDAYFSGPEPDQFPPIVCSCPVDWDYYGTPYDLHFYSGFNGFCQDTAKDGTVSPSIGWVVAHDKPQPPQQELDAVENEIEALSKGHEDDPNNESFLGRIKRLVSKRDMLKKKLGAVKKSQAIKVARK